MWLNFQPLEDEGGSLVAAGAAGREEAATDDPRNSKGICKVSLTLSNSLQKEQSRTSVERLARLFRCRVSSPFSLSGWSFAVTGQLRMTRSVGDTCTDLGLSPNSSNRQLSLGRLALHLRVGSALRQEAQLRLLRLGSIRHRHHQVGLHRLQGVVLLRPASAPLLHSPQHHQTSARLRPHLRNHS